MAKARKRAGNRGAVLVILGVVWLVMGTVVHPRVSDPTSDVPKPVLLHERLPLWMTLLLWTLPGAIAIVAAFWKRLDPNGWGLLFVGPAVRLASYFWGWVTDVYPAGWRGFIIWGAVAFLINRCAAGLDRAEAWNGEERRHGWTQGSGH